MGSQKTQLALLAVVALGFLLFSQLARPQVETLPGQFYLAKILEITSPETGLREFRLEATSLGKEFAAARALPETGWSLEAGQEVLITFVQGKEDQPFIVGPSPWGPVKSGKWLTAPVTLSGSNGARIDVTDQVNLKSGDASVSLGGFPGELELSANSSKILIDHMGNIEIDCNGTLKVDSWRDIELSGNNIILKPDYDLIIDCNGDVIVDTSDFEIEAREFSVDAYDLLFEGRTSFKPEPWKD